MYGEASGGDAGSGGIVEEVHPGVGVDGLGWVHSRSHCRPPALCKALDNGVVHQYSDG